MNKFHQHLQRLQPYHHHHLRMKKQDNQLLLLRNGDEQGKKAAISTSTREYTAKYSNSEEEIGTEISTESKELDYIFLGDSSKSDSELESDEFDWSS